MSPTSGIDEILKSNTEDIWKYALSPSMMRTYNVRYNLYIKFLVLCSLFVPGRKSPPPISENHGIKFVIYCADILHLKWSTIKLYLAGVKFNFIKAGYGKPLEYCSQLSYIINAVRRRQSLILTESRNREPITFKVLHSLCQLLKAGAFNSHTDEMLMCAFQMAFFGFLCCAEFTIQDHSDHNIVYIQDIVFSGNPNSYTLLLRGSKTDPFQKGVSILICSNHVLCPVTSMRNFIARRLRQGASQSSPLFQDYDNSILTRFRFISYLRHLLIRMGLNENLYGGHSFRIGAATAAGAAGIEDHMIQTLGRWSSDCYVRYIKTSRNSISKAQMPMCANYV